jgi:hypothetical protein
VRALETGRKASLWRTFLALFSHGPNKAFLVPTLYRATERNSNSISAEVTDDTIEND